MKKLLPLITLSFLCLMIAPATPAQDTVTGAFEGTVTSSLTGAPVEGATVEIINIETGVASLKRSDSRGRFYQGLLLPGPYRIRVSQEGFQPREVLQRLNIARTGEVVPVPVTLDPATVATAPPTGQSVIYAELTSTVGGSRDDFGLFFCDDDGDVMKVAREGDALLGSTIAELTFGPTFGLLGAERTGLNNLGQVAFRFRLADGREGIGLWTPIPEPTGALLSLIGCALFRRAP